MRLNISARKSDLARIQAYRVGEALQKKFPQTKIDFFFKESLGDKNLTDPLWKIPEKGVFTEDFYQELIRGETDMVVHSWKDLPTEAKPDTEIVATLPRADQRDLLVIKKNHIEKIKSTKFFKIFSSSPRRAYNLGPFLQDTLPFGKMNIQFESVRGNIPTRFRKLIEADDISGLIVAKAALDRLLSAAEAEFSEVQKVLREQLNQCHWMVLPLSQNPNAAAQGALAIEILKNRDDLKEILNQINDVQTFLSVQKEREVLAQFGGGCHQKIGIAVLPRPYGVVQICRGQTDAGVVLEQFEIVNENVTLNSNDEKYEAHEMWSSSSVSIFEREKVQFQEIPATVNAILVTKEQAWPEDFKFSGIVWVSGSKTWKKLAQKGIWVNGSLDGLGEQEKTEIDILFGQKTKWLKLSHQDGFQDGIYELNATYRLLPQLTDLANMIKGKRCFFWTSGSQFYHALNVDPSIIDKAHYCGPGNTLQMISAELNRYGKKVKGVFLSQQEWMKKCQK